VAVGTCTPLLAIGGIVAGVVALTTIPDPKPQFLTAGGGTTAGGPAAGGTTASGTTTGGTAVGGTTASNTTASGTTAGGTAGSGTTAVGPAGGSGTAGGGTAAGGMAAGGMAASDTTAGGTTARNTTAGGTAARSTTAVRPASGHPVPPPLTSKRQIRKQEIRPTTVAQTNRVTTHSPLRATPPAEIPAPAPVAPPAVKSRPVPKAPAKPVITTRTETETRQIPYATRFVHDSSLPFGEKQVQSPGVTGERTLRFRVTLTNRHRTGRRLLSSTVTRQPKQKIIALGNKSSDQDDDQWPGGGLGWPDGGLGWPGVGLGWGEGTSLGQHDGVDFDGQCGTLCLPWGRSASCSTGQDPNSRNTDATAARGGRPSRFNEHFSEVANGAPRDDEVAL
jgi:hypothetical protein